MCVPENEWKRPTVNMAIWKERGGGGGKSEMTGEEKSGVHGEQGGLRRGEEEGGRRDVHYCSTVEGGVSQQVKARLVHK